MHLVTLKTPIVLLDKSSNHLHKVNAFICDNSTSDLAEAHGPHQFGILYTFAFDGPSIPLKEIILALKLTQVIDFDLVVCVQDLGDSFSIS